MTQQNDEQLETDKTDLSQPWQSFLQAPLTLVPRTPVAVVEPRSDICPSVDLGFDPGPQGLLQISPGGVGNLESSS